MHSRPSPLATLLAPLAALLMLAAPLAPAQAQTARAATDWSTTVTALPSGAFLLGNPNARTKLVEYFSYTCPHCADFAKDATPELKARIRSGALSMEYRSYLLNAFDIPPSLLARCGGASKFLAAHDGIYAAYNIWIEAVQAYATANPNPGAVQDRGQLFIDIADKVGLTALVAKTGQTPAALHQCLADKQALSAITQLSASAWDADRDFSGTPTFLVNGQVARGAHSWGALKPLLPPLPAPAN